MFAIRVDLIRQQFTLVYSDKLVNLVENKKKWSKLMLIKEISTTVIKLSTEPKCNRSGLLLWPQNNETYDAQIMHCYVTALNVWIKPASLNTKLDFSFRIWRADRMFKWLQTHVAQQMKVKTDCFAQRWGKKRSCYNLLACSQHAATDEASALRRWMDGLVGLMQVGPCRC